MSNKRSEQHGFIIDPFRFGVAVTAPIHMDFEGTNGGSVFTDDGLAGTTWTRSGANVTTDNTVFAGGASGLRIQSNADYLEAAADATNFLPASADWRITFRLVSTSGTTASGNNVLSIQDSTASAAGTQFAIYIPGGSANEFYFYFSDGTTRALLMTSVVVVGTNVTRDYELNRVGNTISWLVNGVLDVSASYSASIAQPSGTKWRIGKPEFVAGLCMPDFSMDNLRVYN